MPVTELWALVPVKPLRQAKSRLAAVLTPLEREQLARALLVHTLTVLAELLAPPEQPPDATHPLRGVLVVSADPTVQRLAAAQGGVWVPESEPPDLNGALEIAAAAAQARGAQGVLVVPADLPRLTAVAVAALVAAAGEPPVVLLAPDCREEGTNALLMAPPGLLRFSFGPGSWQRHREAALAAGVRLVSWRQPVWACDLDWPEDLACLKHPDGGNQVGRSGLG